MPKLVTTADASSRERTWADLADIRIICCGLVVAVLLIVLGI